MDSQDDQKRFQDDKESMVARSENWQIPFPPDKTRVMHMGKPLSSRPKTDWDRTYHPHNRSG